MSPPQGICMSDTEKGIWAPCAECRRKTRHNILHEKVVRGDENYDFIHSYQIIQCRGCESISFRDYFQDIENAWPNENDDWEVPEEIKLYPKRTYAHQSVDIYLIPDIVRDIYKETIISIEDDALTLASLGLRGTIEAVCNEQKVPGKNLDTRINKLAALGLISSKDAERLHAIRFLGNDAAHDIKKPKISQVNVALGIVDHLIRSVYILELEANGSLETIVTRPEEFKILLDTHLALFGSGDEFPLAKFLGKDMRRLGGGASALEAQLIAEISAGTYSKLSIGQHAVFQGSKSPVQHFVVK